MTKSRMLMLLALLVLLVIGLPIRAYWVAPKLVDVERAIRDLWANSGDTPVTIEGAPSFALVPPAFVLSDARITTERGAVIGAGKISFEFSFTSLITGHYKIAAITIDQSRITLPLATPLPTKQITEKLVIDFVSFFDSTPKGATFDDIELIRFRDATFQIGDMPKRVSLAAPSADLRRSGDGTLVLSGRIAIQNQPLSIDLTIGPRERSASDGRATKLMIQNGTTTLQAQGKTAFDQNLQFLGTLNFATQNVKALEDMLGNRLPPLTSAATELDADARLSFSAMTLSDMNLKIGATRIQGNVIADIASELPRLTGTLAATILDLSDFVDTIGMKRDDLGQWNTKPMPRNLVPDTDLDIRLSADKVVIHDLSITSVALSALLRNQKAELTLASSDWFDGSLTGKIEIADTGSAGRYDFYANSTFDGIDLEKLGLAFADTKRIAGKSSGTLSLRASGASNADLMADLNGKVDLTSERNTIEGLDLLAFLRRIEARPIGAVLGFRNGKTEFDTGELSLDIRAGVANLVKAKLTKFPELQVRMNGAIDLAKQNFAISGHALASSAQTAERAIDLPFALQGPFDDPAFIPDFANVTKQSGAVTP